MAMGQDICIGSPDGRDRRRRRRIGAGASLHQGGRGRDLRRRPPRGVSGDAIIWADGTRSSLTSPHPSVIIGNKSSVIVGQGVFVGQGKGVVPMENPSDPRGRAARCSRAGVLLLIGSHSIHGRPKKFAVTAATGKSIRTLLARDLSRPSRKNIPLSPSGKSLVQLRAISPDERGVARRHERGVRCGGRGAGAKTSAREGSRTAKSCGPGAPVLALSFARSNSSGMTVAKKPVTGESSK